MRVLTVKCRENPTFALFFAGALLCCVLMVSGTAWASTFKTVNGEVVIQAENYTRLDGTIGGTWYLNSEMAGYTGTGYMQSTTDDPGTLAFNRRIIRAEYDINFQETGTYYLHLRTYAADHTENGFFATMDGVLFNYGHPDAYFVFVKQHEQNPRWWWYTDSGGAEGRGYKVSITITEVGVQTFALYRRDKGTRVDQIWLTKNQSVPQDVGTLNLTDPAVFLVPPPFADAGDDQVVAENTLVTLDGSLSVGGHADAPIIDYLWVQTLGAEVDLTGAETVSPTFMAPPMEIVEETPLTFQLTVIAQDGQHASDQVDVSVVVAPVAVAGEAQRVAEGTVVTLDGTGSTGTNLTYLWSQTAPTAPLVVDSVVNSPTLTFSAPEVVGAPVNYVFELTVTDEYGLFDSALVNITVSALPVADAGEAQVVIEGAVVNLDGTGSTGNNLTFLWEQFGTGTMVALTGASSDTATFTAPGVTPSVTAETLTFRLTVTDDIGLSDNDTITVTINPTNALNTSGGGSGGCFMNSLF